MRYEIRDVNYRCEMRDARCEQGFYSNLSSLIPYLTPISHLLSPIISYLIFFSFISYLLFLSPICLYPAFVDLGAGARPLGMGNAFVAVADDANTIMYNPAGLTRIKQEELTAMYSKLHAGISGLSSSYVSYVYPIDRKYGALGFGWHNFTTKDLYSENILVFSYGHRLMNRPLISAGINLKYLSKEYETNEWTAINPVFSDGAVAHGFSMDLGLLCRPYKPLFIGLSFENLNNPDIGLKATDRVPINYRFGVAYNIEEFSIIKNIITTVETTYREKEYKVHTGFEGWFLNKAVALRFGYGIGSHDDKDITAGTGYLFKLKDIGGQIDYAWVYPLNFIEGISGTHRFSMSMRFGKVIEELEEMKEVNWEEKRIKQEVKSFNESGIKFYKKGEFLKAYDEFNKVLEINPKDKKSKKYIKKIKKRMENVIDKGQFKEKEELFYAKGFIHYADGVIEDAVPIWERFLASEPFNEEVKEYLDKYKRNKEKEKLDEERKRLEEKRQRQEEEKRRLEEEKQRMGEEISALKEKLKNAEIRETERGLVIDLKSAISFRPNSAKLSPKSDKALDEFVEILQAYPKNKISIEGHTDSTGRRRTNMKLSKDRAQSVADYFITHGILEERVAVIGCGPDKPIVSNKTSKGRMRNRRVEIIILKE